MLACPHAAEPLGAGAWCLLRALPPRAAPTPTRALPQPTFCRTMPPSAQRYHGCSPRFVTARGSPGTAPHEPNRGIPEFPSRMSDGAGERVRREITTLPFCTAKQKPNTKRKVAAQTAGSAVRESVSAMRSNRAGNKTFIPVIRHPPHHGAGCGKRGIPVSIPAGSAQALRAAQLTPAAAWPRIPRG